MSDITAQTQKGLHPVQSFFSMKIKHLQLDKNPGFAIIKCKLNNRPWEGIMNFTRTLLAVAVTSTLVACGGGGGGGSEPSTPAPPVVTPPPPTPPAEPDCGGDLPHSNYVLSEVDVTNDLYSTNYTVVHNEGFPFSTDIYQNVEKLSDIYEVIDDANVANTGSLVERFSLSSGQCIQAGGLTDCDRGYSRTESKIQHRELRGYNRWYAITFKIDRDTYDDPGRTPNGGLSREGTWITQWVNNTTDESRFLGNLFTEVDMYTGTLNLSYKPPGSGNKEIERIAVRNEYFDEWTQLVFNIQFDDIDDGGNVRVWFNGECRVDLDTDTILDGYDEANWKWGLYRSFMGDDIDYLNGERDEPSRQTILMDNIREGNSYEEIAY